MQRNLIRIVIFLVFALLFGCRDDISTLAGVQLRLVSFGNIHPTAVYFEEHPADSIQPSPRARGTLRYQLGPGDSLDVAIEEFRDPVAAYASWLNRGLGPARIPRIIGDRVQQTVWSGKWIFLFTSPSYRLPSLQAIDQLVRSFPETGGGLPAPFLTLPLRERVVNGASVQQGLLLGEPFAVPMLCQRYEDELGIWTAARSLGDVSEKDLATWIGNISSHGGKPLGNRGERTMLLQGMYTIVFGVVRGNLLIVWGLRDSLTLCNRWDDARRTLEAE